MMPVNYPLQLYHGDSAQWEFKLWRDEGKTDPHDLTGVIPKAEIRDKFAGVKVFTLDCEIVAVAEPDVSNTVSVALTALVSDTLPIGALIWDLQLTYPDGTVNTLVAGAVTVTGDVTDSIQPAAASQAQLKIAK